jgi:hypothetical protein
MTRTSLRLAVYLLLICSALPLMAQSAASADSVVPNLVKFTGALNDLDGKPLTGTVGVTFLLYKEQSGGAPLWLETQNVRPDKNGHYSVMLGSSTNQGMPADVFAAGEARWIAVQVSGQAEKPRVQLVSVPYALKAADSQTLGGLPPSAFLLAPPPSAGADASQVVSPSNAANPALSGTGTQNFVPIWTNGTGGLGNSTIFELGGKVGIGTTTPADVLDVKGGVVVRGVLNVPPIGKATAAGGKNSEPLNLSASAFNSAAGTATNQNFRWQVEPLGNNTPNTDGTLNLLYSAGSNPPAETGLKLASNGQIAFASGQTFPGTGSVTSVALSAPASDFTVSGSPITTSGTLNVQWKVAPTSANVPNAIIKRDGSGNFSVGAITATALNGVSDLRVNTFKASQITGSSNNTGTGFAPVIGSNNATGTAEGYGVSAFAENTSGAGVYALNEGGGRGIWAQSVGSSAVFAESFGPGTGAYGYGPDGVDAVAHDNSGIGVFGWNLGSGAGILGKSVHGTAIYAWGGTNGDTGRGIWGESSGSQNDAQGFGPDGVDGISHNVLGSGVVALNTSTGDGLFAQSNFGFAGFFLGDVDVDGTLSKAAGSFKIDHPLDPANKYLYHSFVESPDMMNVYNGNVTTDGQGKAVVQMPEWFEALNRDFRYQLTVIGQFAQAMVASEMANHSFTIQTDKPNVKVSWQVTGIRQDAYANAHRIPVEQVKPNAERGLYLHPELFGAPGEKSIAAARHPGAAKLVKEGKSMLTASKP